MALMKLSKTGLESTLRAKASSTHLPPSPFPLLSHEQTQPLALEPFSLPPSLLPLCLTSKCTQGNLTLFGNQSSCLWLHN